MDMESDSKEPDKEISESKRSKKQPKVSSLAKRIIKEVSPRMVTEFQPVIENNQRKVNPG